jgi:Fe-S-cluster containining protein
MDKLKLEGQMDNSGKPVDQNTDDDMEMPEEQRAYIKKMLKRLMELGIGAVYGDEDTGEHAVEFDCAERLPICKAVCCSFTFAITKEEVQQNIIQWNPKLPYFIKRDEDGYCPHLNRETCSCNIWDDRGQRARKYDCRKDPNVWLDWDNMIINPRVFDHLPPKG